MRTAIRTGLGVSLWFGVLSLPCKEERDPADPVEEEGDVEENSAKG